jgi:hypothetical protein
MIRVSVQPRRTIAQRKEVLFCLLVLLLSFASLVPGGPIETRDFSHMDARAYWAFNAFLTTLGLAGFLAAYFVWRDEARGYLAATVIGWLYIAVVAADLGRVFPVSPDPTGFVLGIIMIADAILALNVVLFSYKALGRI